MTKIQEIYTHDKCKVTLQNNVIIFVQSIDIHEAQDDDGEDLGYEEVVVEVLEGNKVIETLFLKEEDILLVEASE